MQRGELGCGKFLGGRMDFGKLYRKYKREGLLATLLGVIVYAFDFRRRMVYRKMLKIPEVRERFYSIYENNLWGNRESVSGEGSSVGYTENLRNWLEKAVSRYSIISIVDAPCGDMNWMRLVLARVNVDYLGVDIVKSVIDENTKSFASDRIRFMEGDICQDDVPPCDLLIVRDFLIHMSYRDTDRFLRNISRVDFKYLLTTTYVLGKDFCNKDIISGDFRRIDIFGYPYGFSEEKVIESVEDFPPGFPIPRKLVLVAKRDVPTSLASENSRLN